MVSLMIKYHGRNIGNVGHHHMLTIMVDDLNDVLIVSRKTCFLWIHWLMVRWAVLVVRYVGEKGKENNCLVWYNQLFIL